MGQRTAPFRKQKLKKIIAREGLIIISLLFLSAVSFFLDLWLNNQKKAYESNVQEIEPVREEEDKEHGGKYLISQGVTLQFPKNTSNDVIKQALKRDFSNIQGDNWIISDSPKGQNINAFYDEKGNRIFDSMFYKINFLYVYIFFLIVAYPLYLLVRFFVWAIGTLKDEKQVT